MEGAQGALGVYALRCAPTGQVWVGRASDLESVEKRLRFAVKMASTPRRSLLAAAREHGAEAFSFEALERIENEDASPELVWAMLKGRAEHWRAALGAEAL